MHKSRLFNPLGDDANRSIIHGNTTGLFNLNNTKYAWAKSLYQIMVGNFWLPEKVSGFAQDKGQFAELRKEEQHAYKGIISFLIFLDSIQTANLPNFADYITAPEIKLLLSIQAYQEAIHSQSYATTLESVVESQDREAIYDFWRDDEVLLERNKYIGAIYENFRDEPNDQNFFRSIIANFLLESLYFYNGFAFFDTLADSGRMQATGRMIAYIRRDELTHVTLFSHIIREIKRENPEIYNEAIIREMMDQAVKQEIIWSQHILTDRIPGINHETTIEYTQWLANTRLAMLGLDALYPQATKNPYKHLERLQDPNGDRSNFFESTVINYTQSTSMKGSWDF